MRSIHTHRRVPGSAWPGKGLSHSKNVPMRATRGTEMAGRIAVLECTKWRTMKVGVRELEKTVRAMALVGGWGGVETTRTKPKRAATTAKATTGTVGDFYVREIWFVWLQMERTFKSRTSCVP